MLANARALMDVAADAAYPARVTGPLQLLQELRWRPGYGVLKANLLFFYDKDDRERKEAILLLIVEDCFVQIGDDNSVGKEFTFELRMKTTGRSFTFAAEDFKSLERWVTNLSITPIEYMRVTKQSYLEQIEQLEKASTPS